MTGPIGNLDSARIAALLGHAMHGSNNRIFGIDPFPNHRPESLSFLTEAPDTVAPAVSAATVLAPAASRDKLEKAGYTVIVSERPKFDLAYIYSTQIQPLRRPTVGIHPSATIGPDAEIAPTAIIGPGCVLEGRIIVGPRCRLGAHVCLMNDVVMEENVRIRNGSVIGEDAFSFGFGPSGESLRFPSSGGVRIGRNVEIGNNAVISRGVYDHTELHEGSRINDLAHIGNTVIVGKNSLVMANCDISAGVIIGEGCWIAQSAVVLQRVRIGDGAQVGMGSVVTKDVPAGMVVMGVPARVTRPR